MHIHAITHFFEKLNFTGMKLQIEKNGFKYKITELLTKIHTHTYKILINFFLKFIISSQKALTFECKLFNFFFHK